MMQRKRMMVLGSLFTCLLLLSSLGVAQAAMKKRIDNYIYFIDQSGSMLMAFSEPNVKDLKYNTIKYDNEKKVKKLQMVKHSLSRINQNVPALGYNGSVATFAPYKEVWDGGHNAGVIGKEVADISEAYSVYGNLTDMATGLSRLDEKIGGMSGRTGLIIFSDGEVNEGENPVAAAQMLKEKYGENLCIHTVSVADTAKGQAVMDSLASLNSCAANVTSQDLEDPNTLAAFMNTVFYRSEEVPMPTIVLDAITLPILFDFDSAVLNADAMSALDAFLGKIKDYVGPIAIGGHTCNIGTEKYNKSLSQRRADSVKGYFVKQGIPESRVTSIGYGSQYPKYDNKTKEGRHMNRRVDVIIER